MKTRHLLTALFISSAAIAQTMFKANSTLNWHKHSSVQVLAIYGGTTPTEWTEELTREAYDEVAEKLANSK